MEKESSVLVESTSHTIVKARTKIGSMVELPFTKVVVHPLVLLSVVDHFNRMGKIGNLKRVVGLLLGSIKGKGVLDISNSFAGIKLTILNVICMKIIIFFCSTIR